MLKRVLGRKFKRDASKPVLENLAGELSAVLGGSPNWQWDDRLEAVLLQIDSRQKEKVIAVLESYFSDYWNVLCDEELPDNIQRLILHFDGMNPEQLLFSTDTREGDFLYCAWWPWKDGKTTSVRIAPDLSRLSAEHKLARVRQIWQWFHIDDTSTV